MASNKGLGKGLGALLGDVALNQSEGGTSNIKISQIEPNLTQPRKQFDDEALTELSESIKLYGIMQPLAVRRLSSGYYQIIAGERRWRAAKLAGLTEVPALVFDADDRRAIEMAMIENIQRENLNPLEEAEGYKLLMDEYGLTQEETAEKMGKSRSAIANSLRMLSLPDKLKSYIIEGKLSGGHAKAILGLSDKTMMDSVAQKVIALQLSVRQTEELVKKCNRPIKETLTPPEVEVDYWKELEKDLTKKLNRKVKISHGAVKGTLTLEYYDMDDLDGLCNALSKINTK